MPRGVLLLCMLLVACSGAPRSAPPPLDRQGTASMPRTMTPPRWDTLQAHGAPCRRQVQVRQPPHRPLPRRRCEGCPAKRGVMECPAESSDRCRQAARLREEQGLALGWERLLSRAAQLSRPRAVFSCFALPSKPSWTEQKPRLTSRTGSTAPTSVTSQAGFKANIPSRVGSSVPLKWKSLFVMNSMAK